MYKNKKNFFNFPRPYVFVPMAADILHAGHINILKNASKYGSVIVGLMTNKGILSYKKKKPLFSYNHRKIILNNLKIVRKVIPINGLKYVNFAKKYKFDFFVHGSDWLKGPQSMQRLKLKLIMPEWKGKVIDIPYTKGFSSSKFKKQIKC